MFLLTFRADGEVELDRQQAFRDGLARQRPFGAFGQILQALIASRFVGARQRYRVDQSRSARTLRRRFLRLKTTRAVTVTVESGCFASVYYRRARDHSGIESPTSSKGIDHQANNEQHHEGAHRYPAICCQRRHSDFALSAGLTCPSMR